MSRPIKQVRGTDAQEEAIDAINEQVARENERFDEAITRIKAAQHEKEYGPGLKGKLKKELQVAWVIIAASVIGFGIHFLAP